MDSFLRSMQLTSSAPAQPAPVPVTPFYLYLTESSVLVENGDHPATLTIYDPADGRDMLYMQKSNASPQHSGFESLVRELSIPIYGVLGAIRFLSGWFIIVVLDRQLAGKIEDKEVYLVTKTAAYAIPRSVYINEEELRIEKQHLANLNGLLGDCSFYYSPRFDLTRSYQRKSELPDEFFDKPLWQQADHRFFWNRHVSQPFVDSGFADWIFPVMDGFIRIETCTVSSLPFVYVLISRRDSRRTGMRYQTRGADPEGNVANFVETEQIVLFNGNVCSWVEVRGSIPLLWSQSSKGLKPKPEVIWSPFTRQAFKNHMAELHKIYGKIAIVSLIDKKGPEESIGDAFEQTSKVINDPDLIYEAFDFHEECKGGNYDRLQVLVEKMSPQLRSWSYFLKDRNDNVVLKQTGAIRTNCIDCLDRTNVVQSQFARAVLMNQMSILGIVTQQDSLRFFDGFNSMLNNTWTDNANAMSMRYTGVGALKTDFTRTGKRSAKGAMADGVKSAKRMYQSTFVDEDKQSAIELFLGFTSILPFAQLAAEKGNKYNASRPPKTLTYVLSFVEQEPYLTIYTREFCTRKLVPFSTIKSFARTASPYKGMQLLTSTSTDKRVYILLSQYHSECFLKQLAMKINRRGPGFNAKPSSDLISRQTPPTTPQVDLLGTPIASTGPVDLLTSGLLMPSQPSSGSLLDLGPSIANPLLPSLVPSQPQAQPSDLPHYFSNSVSLLDQSPGAFNPSMIPTPAFSSASTQSVMNNFGSPAPLSSSSNSSNNSFDLFPQAPTHQPAPLIPMSAFPTPPTTVPSPNSSQGIIPIPKNNSAGLAPAGPSGPGQAPPSLPPKHTYEESLHVFVGFTSIAWKYVAPLDLSHIPKDKDLYVIAAQPMFHTPPMDYQTSGASHWYYSVQAYLGEEFEVVEIFHTPAIGVIVLVRKAFFFKISNVEKLLIEAEATYKSQSTSVATAPKKDDSSSSTPFSGFKSFFSKAVRAVDPAASSSSSSSAASSTTSKSASSSTVSTEDNPGVAILLSVNETRFCFIALKNCISKWNIPDYDMFVDFDHVFCFGDLINQFYDDSWVPVYTNKLGSIQWHCLYDNQLSISLTPGETPVDSVLPLRVAFNIRTIAPSLPSSVFSDLTLRFRLTNLRANDLILSDRLTRLIDPWLAIHSPVLYKGVKTAPARKTFDPLWPEEIILYSLSNDNEYVRRRHLTLEIRDNDTGYPVGAATLPLSFAFSPQTQSFTLQITYDSDKRGTVSGTIVSEIVPRPRVSENQLV